MKPLLTLCMMLKDEAKALRGVLEAAKPHVDNYCIFVDDRTTDNTEEIIKEVLGEMPGKILREAWLGFAGTRNFVLDAAKELDADFSLFLCADEYLRDGDKMREHLETQRDSKCDCYFLRLTLDTGLSAQARILRMGSAWRYDDFGLGLHEVPVHPDKDAPKLACPEGNIEHAVANPIERMDTIWEVWIPQLRAVLEKDPNNARAIEFLIQHLQSFFPHMEEDERTATAQECVELYQRRFALPFEMEAQRLFFMMHFIDTARLSGDFKPEELFQMAHMLCQADPERPEPFLTKAMIASTIPTFLVSEIYSFAREAAEAAERVRVKGGLSNSSPYDMTTEWRAHRLAAIAASNLAKKYPEQLQLAKDHIAAGLATGGPWMAFKDIAEDDTISASVSLDDVEAQPATEG